MLDSLTIQNFRCLQDFQVSKLGRVNLIVGKNNSGKSTVLEALRVYAGNAQRPLLEAISAEHDEKYRVRDTDLFEAEVEQPFQDYFTGRHFPADDDTAIKIGSAQQPDSLLTISHVLLAESEETVTDNTGATSTRIRRQVVPKAEAAQSPTALTQALRVTKGGPTNNRTLQLILLNEPQRRRGLAPDSPSMACSVIPTQFISVDELADEWDRIVLTEHEDLVRQALRIITPDFENLTFVRSDENNPLQRLSLRRSAKVKLGGTPRPVPLNSLGDGMLRVLQLVLKLFPARGGFLLIDEFENGLHYSVQERVWELVFEMAKRLDIQVFATTHSWDCIESFSKTAKARNDIDGVLFRVGKSVRTSDRGRVIATVFDEDALYSITQSDAEVR